VTKIVNEESFTIGRSIDCAISLSEDSISRVHLIVTHQNNEIFIEDKGSSNGTFINEERISRNTPVRVMPTDGIRIGKSEYVLNIAVDAGAQGDESTSTLPIDISPMPAVQQVVSKIAEKAPVVKDEKRAGDVFIHKIDATADLRVPQRVAKVEAPFVENSAMFEGERILHEAHKKAAQIIYESEAKAEKRVQAIYIQAREKQAEADSFYQKKISQAHKEADAIIVNFQSQGQELIIQARNFAEEMRDEVELYVQGLREKAKKEVEDILLEAKEEANAIKNETYEKALSKAGIDAEDMLANARSESQDILSFAKLQSEEMLTTARNEIQDQIADLLAQAEEKKKALQALKKELEELTIKSLGDKEERDLREQEWQVRYNTLKSDVEKAELHLKETKADEAKVSKEVADAIAEAANLKKQIEGLSNGKKTLEARNKELQEQLGRFQLDIQAGEERKRQMDHEYEQQKTQVRERLEREKQEMMKEGEERIQEAHLEISKRMEKIERDLFEEILGRKEKIVREVMVVIETRIAKVLEPSKWDEVSGLVYEGVHSVIEGKAISFTGMTEAPTQSSSLKRKKKKEHLRWLSGGVVAGVALMFIGLQVQMMVKKDQNPMRTIANEESRKKKEDLERRKFNPPQVRDAKETYVDSVIYTAGFAAKYQDPEFQQKLYKAASAYLLKTWRVDEDKSIQVLSIASALVKELSDKKESIHPDYVKVGIAKMRALELASVTRMKALLGSEVRYESFRRFENKFFEDEVQK
jgi:hypothetical protein